MSQTLSSIEAVELLRKTIGTHKSNESIVDTIEKCTSLHPVVLARRVNDISLYELILKYCASRKDMLAAKAVIKTITVNHELANELKPLKHFLLGLPTSEVSISGLLLLDLEETEVDDVCRRLKASKIKMGSWAIEGLRFPRFLQFCESYPDIVDSLEMKSKINQLVVNEVTSPFAFGSNSLSPKVSNVDDSIIESNTSTIKSLKNGSQTDIANKVKDTGNASNSESRSTLVDKSAQNTSSTLYPISVSLIQTFPYHEIRIPPDYWHKILFHEKYCIRCAAAECLGKYVGIGKYQEDTLRILLKLKQKASPDVYIKALAAALMTLDDASSHKPARMGNELFSQQDMVISLTQQTVRPTSVAQKKKETSGIYSFLNCFQIQTILYLQLAEMLKHEDPVASIAAQNFHLISQRLGKTPWQLFHPFWPSVAPYLLRNYDSSFIDWFCVSVLRVQRSDFMLRNAIHTVPRLCLAQQEKSGACIEIADLMGCNINKLYFSHVAGIIALVFLNVPWRQKGADKKAFKNIDDVDEIDMAWAYAEDRFYSLSKGFRRIKFDVIVAKWHVAIIYNILILTTEDNTDFTVKLINRIMDCQYSLLESDPRDVFQQTVFKLIVNFSETMRNVVSRQSLSTKISALIGLEILVSKVLSSELVASVLHQLTAFLQAALETNILAESALNTWLAVLGNVDDGRLESIIDLTISIINDRIELWDRPTIQKAKQIVSYINSRVEANPSVFDLHAQSVFEDEHAPQNSASDSNSNSTAGATSVLANTNDSTICYDILNSLVQRDIENNYLARQTARDICAFFLCYQNEILIWAQTNCVGHDLLGKAVRLLLRLCSKKDVDLKSLSARALGLLGALDSHNTTIAPKDNVVVIVNNFGKGSGEIEDEVVDFCKMLIKNMFLPAFEAAIDPAIQKYYAYGIQQLLQFMINDKSRALEDIFVQDGLIDALRPLLKTKYKSDLHLQSPDYPIFHSSIKYDDWLKIFCSDMMNRLTGPENAVQIFGWCGKVLHGSNAGKDMWETLIPYVALCSVTDKMNSSSNQDSFLQEILPILELSGESLHPFHERIFAIVDYFNLWMHARRQASLEVHYIEQLLGNIPALLMADRAFESASLPRAIKYYEQHLRETPQSRTIVMRQLRTMYAEMQDSDNLEGISAHISTLTISQQVQEYTATSQWDAALACYNALPADEATVTKMLECLHNSGREKEVLTELEGDTLHSVELAPLGVECAWSVRDWALLKKWTKLVDPDIPNKISQIPSAAVKDLGDALLSLKTKDRDTFIACLDNARKSIGIKLGNVVSTHHITSLRQIRELTVFLHGLADVESLAKLVMPDDRGEICIDHTTTQEVREKLNGRLKVLSTLSGGPEFEARRFLLSLRGAALSCVEAVLPDANQLVAETHLEISSAARRHKQPTIALTEIAKAKQLNHADADSEHARLFWSLGDTRAAIKTIKSQIPPNFFETPNMYPSAAPLALECTYWSDITAQSDSRVLMEQYNSVVQASPKWGKAEYMLAKYYVKMFDTMDAEKRNRGDIARQIVSHFSKALLLKTEGATEALPKMITTWLDLGVHPPGISKTDYVARRSQLKKANLEIIEWGAAIDKKLLYTAIPQLLSRFSHENHTIKSLITQLVSMVVVKFPYHTLWSVFEKTNATKAILEDAQSRLQDSSVFSSLVSSASIFHEKIIQLCRAPLIRNNVQKARLSEFRVDFSDCFNKPQLAVPVQKVMNSLENVHMYDIEKSITIQNSLQKPKRISVWGSNGERYYLLLKRNDDVRKDARLIEFTSAVNQLLQSDPAAGSRYLEILTYRVTPLNDKAGIIEWVDGAEPARAIITKLSRSFDSGRKKSLVSRLVNKDSKLVDKLVTFKQLEIESPPVLYEWFLNTFPDPEAWLNSRSKYSRSLAVMSMVGYILGLGDRHLENILLIRNSGSVLHVDFDCIFDKGAHLTVPELVPFRLTQQFCDALGAVNGYEGPFRKVCEITMKIIRDHEDLLMVILESFVHDPVVKDRASSEPISALNNARARIRGIIKGNTAPLGVNGVVDELINEATSSERLCQMYRGWMAWL